MFNFFKLQNYNDASKSGLSYERLTKLCFQNMYVKELLTRFRFQDIKNVTFADKVILILISFNRYIQSNFHKN